MNAQIHEITSDDYEKMGAFYLGKRYDDKNSCLTSDLLLYDSRDLVTHAVCIGMTGSGKTGLCLSLLEEAAIDQIPVIAVDPKGDLGNLLLSFPDLKAADFEPWVDADEARRLGKTKEELAALEASRWKEGLSQWNQTPDRIARMRANADFCVYTPGSSAGSQISLLSSLDCPRDEILEDRELLRDQIAGIVSGLLTLLDRDTDPVKSRDHILLSAIINHLWCQGDSPDFTRLVELIQKPPVKQMGALAMDTFYPPAERFELSMALNNLLSAPGFEAWTEGEPLDISKLLYSEMGKPRLSVLSIAHLSQQERMFFVSLLLSKLNSWMHQQSGTTSLRAIFFMDEIHGYLPPVANPPSKKPLLNLLKQARAFGLGIVLSTQNPVDLDYKGLGNTGTWFLGRLQTERDKKRVMDGLQSAAEAAGRAFDNSELDRLLSALPKRVFLMNNVHEDAPVLFMSRWSLSYLKGPLSRKELKTLTKETPRTQSAKGETSTAVPPPDGLAGTMKAGSKPMVEPSVPERFAPAKKQAPQGAKLVYKPMLCACAEIRFTDTKTSTDTMRKIAWLTLLKEGQEVSFEKTWKLTSGTQGLLLEPEKGIEFGVLPQEAASPKSYNQWGKQFETYLYNNEKLELLSCASAMEVSLPEESERDFRVRLSQKSHENRDRKVAELKAKYSSKLQALQDKLSKAESRLETEAAQASQAQLESTLLVGSSILGAFMGRKKLSVTSINRATSAAGKMARADRQEKEKERAADAVEVAAGRLNELEAEFKREVEALEERMTPQTCLLEKVVIPPRKTNINVTFTGLVWAPCIRQEDGKITAAW